MAHHDDHYEQAFAAYLRSRRIPYVLVDEARKALAPGAGAWDGALKSFDMVIYRDEGNLLVDVKGRKSSSASPAGIGRLESWVTMDDVESLRAWERLFGAGFSGAFVFIYWCVAQPPDGLFQEVFEHQGRWYAVRFVTLADYAGAMKTRSPRWRTVHLPTREYERLSRPFVG